MGAHGARRTVGGFLPSPFATVLWVEGLAPLILGGSLSDKGERVRVGFSSSGEGEGDGAPWVPLLFFH